MAPMYIANEEIVIFIFLGYYQTSKDRWLFINPYQPVVFEDIRVGMCYIYPIYKIKKRFIYKPFTLIVSLPCYKKTRLTKYCSENMAKVKR